MRRLNHGPVFAVFETLEQVCEIVLDVPGAQRQRLGDLMEAARMVEEQSDQVLAKHGRGRAEPRSVQVRPHAGRDRLADKGIARLPFLSRFEFLEKARLAGDLHRNRYAILI